MKGFAGKMRVEVRPDGFINATRMCKMRGKSWSNYEKTQTTRNFLDVLCAELKCQVTDLVDSKCGGHARAGTWVHPSIRDHLQNWCCRKTRNLGTGYVYAATSDLLDAVKIGMWRGSIDNLKSRYGTPYGPSLRLRYVAAEDCVSLESELHRRFDPHNLGGELFAKEHLDDYVAAMEAAASAGFA